MEHVDRLPTVEDFADYSKEPDGTFEERSREQETSMGAISRVTHSSGRRAWQTRWRDPSGRQRAKNFDRKVDAERYLLAMETDKLRGRYTDPRLAKTALADWLADYQATRVNLGLQTQERDQATIRNHVLPSFGTWAVGSIQPIHVAQWVANLNAQGSFQCHTRRPGVKPLHIHSGWNGHHRIRAKAILMNELLTHRLTRRRHGVR